MHQENHWPLGSRLVQSKDAASSVVNPVRANGVHSPSNLSSLQPTDDRFGGDRLIDKRESFHRDNRPIDWLGRS
jgi:hypothetical protein